MINFEFETNEIITGLKEADGYLNCENIIIHNIKKHMINEVEITDIERFLKELYNYFQDESLINKDNAKLVNYSYAAAFLNTIIATPYWHSWIRTPG